MAGGKRKTRKGAKSNRFGEKIRSCGFKTLLLALKNNYESLVPLEEREKLTEGQRELVNFLQGALSQIPQVSIAKAGQEEALNSLRDADISLVDPIFPYMFGFNSYNRQFQKRMVNDPLLTPSLYLLLHHYKNFKSKYQKEFRKIFAEMIEECESYFSHQYRKDCQNLAFTSCKSVLVNYLATKSLTHNQKDQLIELVDAGKYSECMFMLCRYISQPLTIATLSECFEVYLNILKVHYLGNSSNYEDQLSFVYNKDVTAAVAQTEEVEMIAEEKPQQEEYCETCEQQQQDVESPSSWFQGLISEQKEIIEFQPQQEFDAAAMFSKAIAETLSESDFTQSTCSDSENDLGAHNTNSFYPLFDNSLKTNSDPLLNQRLCINFGDQITEEAESFIF